MRRLALVCHGATRATRLAAFPADEPLDSRRRDMPALPQRLHGPAHCFASPAQCAMQTAAALSLRADAEPLLRDCDFGRWAGRPIVEVGRDEGDGLAQWLADPAAAPHGGESIVALIARAGAWLVGLEKLSGQIVAVTHQAVIRAAIIQALDLPPQVFWRIDVPPLAIVELTHNDKRWALALRGAS